MKLMLQSVPRASWFRRGGTTGTPCSTWRMEGAGIVPETAIAALRTSVFVPSEDVLILVVDLPLPSRRRRLEALPFAIEDAIAQPIEELHLVLGPQVAPNRYIAAVVRHAVMQEWVARLGAVGLDQAALVPDVMTLPRWAEDGWTVDVRGVRVRVRTANGAGFVLPLAQLGTAWAAGGRPRCRVVGGFLPAQLVPAEAIESAPELRPDTADLGFDLRTGRYAARRARTPKAVKRFGWIAVGGTLAHSALAAADSYALQRLAERREEETRAMLVLLAPHAAASADIIDAATTLLPQSGTAPPPGRFLPLLARVATLSAGTGTRWQALRYDEAGGRLTLDIEAEGAEGLEGALNALVRAGIAAELDGVDVGAEGRMRGRLAIASTGTAP